MRWRRFAWVLMASLMGAAAWGQSPEGSSAGGWKVGPFTRPASGNPAIAPRRESTFADPIAKAPVHWEALHTFNPAAVVRNGKVVVLYRAEDDSGAMEIGGHTSRLGMAESADGIHFTRRAERCFFPPRIASRRASGRAAWKIRAWWRAKTARMC